MTPVPSGLQLLPEFFRTAHTKPIPSLGLFDVPTGYIFISCTEIGYNPIKTGVL
jgi:hypothetical protein